MNRLAVLSFLIAVGAGSGCGSSPADPMPPRPPADAAASDAAPAPPDPVPLDVPSDAAAPSATLGALVVAGELDAVKVRALLERRAPELATCLGAAGPTTTELSLALAKSAIVIRNAWQNDTATVPMCLRAIFEDKEQWPATTMVYVVVEAGPAGTTAPAAPVLADRRAEVQRMFCDLEKLAGADKLGVPEKQNAMIAWARDHIKHPVPLQIASDVQRWNPAERTHKLHAAIKAEGITKCALQRF